MKPESLPDTTTLNGRASCQRKAGPWKCELTQWRSFTTVIHLPDRKQKVAVTMPVGFKAEDVNPLLYAAIAVAANQASVASCGADDPFGASLSLEDPHAAVTILEDADTVSIGSDGEYVFTREQSRARFRFKCTAGPVLVTS